MRSLLKQTKKFQAENKRVLITLTDGSRVSGNVFFAGKNEILDLDQITIDRTPYRMDEIIGVEEQILPEKI